MMRTFWYAGLLLVLTGFILVACQSGDINLGQSVINPQGLLIQPIDSVSIRTSTVLRTDSFATSGDANILLGQWIDAQTGRLTVRSYTSLDYTANSLASLSNIQLDSVVLELGVAFTYGDTTNAFTLNVHRLINPLVREAPPIAGRVYYNTSSAAYETRPLLRTTIVPQPITGTPVIRLRFPNELAQSFYSRLVSGEIYDVSTLERFMPGFAFVTDQSVRNSFRGIAVGSTATGLRLYYHSTDATLPNAVATSQNILFSIRGVHFAQLTNDRSGTPLSALQNRSAAVTSSQTNNTSFISWGAGLQTRIEFPYLNQFALPNNYVGVNSAVLVVSPVRNDLRDNTTPPAQLTLYETNSQNEIITAVPGTASGGVTAVADYVYDPSQLTLTDTYTFDLTAYMGRLVRQRTVPQPLLLTIFSQTTPTLQQLVQRVAIGNQQRPNDEMKVQLFLTSGL